MYPFFPFSSFFLSLAPRKKKARPSFVFIKQRVQDSISSGAVFARKKNFRRWTRGGGRGSFCEKLSVRSLLPKGTLFFFSFLLFLTGLVSLIYPVILEPRGTIRTFVRLPELVHPLDEKKERNKVLACSSFTAAYYKQGAGLGSGNIPRNIPSSFPYRRTNASDPPKTNRPVEKFHRFRNVVSFLVGLYYFIVKIFIVFRETKFQHVYFFT